MIKIEYDGEYPCLCMGHLKVWVDDKLWDFGTHCMRSGGQVTSDEDWNFEVEQDEWQMPDFPEGFPVELHNAVLEEINSEVTQGCCGGCI